MVPEVGAPDGRGRSQKLVLEDRVWLLDLGN